MTVVRWTSTVAAVACVLGAIAPAASAAAGSGEGVLGPELAKLAKPSVRSLSQRAQANALDVPAEGPGSLVREGGRVLVEARFEGGAVSRLKELKAAGAEVVAASRRYQTVAMSVAPADLPAVASVPGAGSVTAVPQPEARAAGSCEGGSVISEGVEQLEVLAAREAFGLRGAGVTVGILSDSYDSATHEAFGAGPIATHAHEDIQSNDLPGPAGTCGGQQVRADVIEEASPLQAGEVGDEGRAMMQIVHDVVPHAKLAFATAFRSELSFAQNIEQLARPVEEGGAGATVIVDDVSYFKEPFFQDGPVANAIAKVVSEGVTYLTAAGNDNLFDAFKHEIGSWEAPGYRDGSCPTAVQEYLVGKKVTPHCMDFDPGAGTDGGFRMTVKRESDLTVDLQWAEPWNGVETDLDVYLVAGGQVVERKETNNLSTQQPVELLDWKNSKTVSQEVELVINRCTGETCNPASNPAAMPGLKFILLGPVTKTEYPSSSGGDVVGPTIYGHATSTSAITLGAVPYTSNTVPETYSSRGPATHLFGPVLGTTPAAKLPAPEAIEKPDAVATDCGATTFFASFNQTPPPGTWRFCGTSAAAPHAAGIAALMVQAAAIQGGTISPEAVANGLTSSAVLPAGAEPDAMGAGLLNAKAALEAIGAAPTATDPPSPPVPPLEGEEEVEYEPELPTERETVPVTPTPNPGPTISPAIPTPEQPAPERVAPSTAFARHPGRLISTAKRTARVAFTFAADQSGVAFLCQFDGAPYRRCGARVTRFFGLGPHVVRVKAQASGGLLDPTPAVFRFRVVWKR